MKGLILGGVLCALALAVAWNGEATLWLAGLRPLGSPRVSELDDPPKPDEASEPRFLAERDVVDLETPRDMTAGELLRLYQLDEFPHIRRQLAEQLGLAAWADGQPLKKGQRFRIALTEPVPPGP